MNRRDALRAMGAGFGTLGLINVLHAEAAPGPLAPKAPHFPPKAKRVIFLFLNGGMSHIDTFDPKPMLTKHDGEPMPGPKIQTDRASGNLMRSPFEFRKYGQSGTEVSEIFPRVASLIDDICVIRSMYSDNGNHGPSLLMMNCGHGLTGRPSMGSWITYGLGTENQNLPGFVVLCPGYPVLGAQLWNSAFLPSVYQGTYIPSGEREPDKLLANIRNKYLRRERTGAAVVAAGQAEPILSGAVWGISRSWKRASRRWRSRSGCRRKRRTCSTFRRRVRRRARGTATRDFGRGCLMALRLAERGVADGAGLFRELPAVGQPRRHPAAREAGAGGRRADRRADRGSEGTRACSKIRC